MNINNNINYNNLSRNIEKKNSSKKLFYNLKSQNENFIKNNYMAKDIELEKHIHYKSLIKKNKSSLAIAKGFIPNKIKFSKIKKANNSINDNIIINSCNNHIHNIFDDKKEYEYFNNKAGKRRPCIIQKNLKKVLIPFQFDKLKFFTNNNSINENELNFFL